MLSGHCRIYLVRLKKRVLEISAGGRELFAGLFDMVKRSNSRGKAKEKEQKIHGGVAPFADRWEKC